MMNLFVLLRAFLVFALFPYLLFGNSFLIPRLKNHGSYKSLKAHESQSLKPLLGHVPADVGQAQRIAQVDENSVLKLSVVLPLNNQAELDEFLVDITSPNSHMYGQYLEQDEFMARFAPTKEQVSFVSSYLTQNGLYIESVEPNRMIIKVSGRVSEINRLFHTELYHYQDESGEQFFAPAYELQVDENLPILSVLGLENRVKARSHLKMINPSEVAQKNMIDGQLVSGYAPSDIKKAYSLSSNLNGAGQTLALFELDGFAQSDIIAYEKAFGLPNVPLEVITVDGFSGAPGSGAGEVTLDIELMIALSPGVSKIIVYEGPNTTAGLVDTYNKIATDNRAKSISTSWGLSENQSQGSTIQSENQIFKQMAAQGQALFAASGDSGAYDDGKNLGVDDPASQPMVVGVGGTNLTLNADKSYAKETTWSYSAGPGQGGGGGISAVWSIPSWQQGVANSNNKASSTMRNVPDVALDADPQTGYAIYYGGSWTVFGGTSCAAPLWAAFWAQVNQQRALNGQTALGFPNTYIYQAGSSSSYSTIFHDVTVGTNGFYPAVTGFDVATGFGTFIGDKLTAYLAPSSGPSPVCTKANPTVTITPATQSGAPGSTLSYSVAVANNDSSACSASSFNLSGDMPSRFNYSLSQSSLTIQPGQSGSLSLSVTSPANTTSGDKSFSIMAVNASDSSLSGMGSGVYSVLMASNLALKISPINAWFALGSTASWTLALSNNQPIVNNLVNIVISGPQSVTGSGKTGAGGLLNVSWRPGLRGTYLITASTTYQGNPVSVQTSFIVY